MCRVMLLVLVVVMTTPPGGVAGACPALPHLRQIPLKNDPPQFIDPDHVLFGDCGSYDSSSTGISRQTTSHGEVTLTVEAYGPEGSGRYWLLKVMLRDGAKPIRETCLTTTTIGWRTLQGTIDTPLPFTADSDGDGDLELVLWSSFPIGEHGTMAENALSVWVYEHHGDALHLDMPLSRTRSQEIAAAYRHPLVNGNARLKELRVEAAARLQAFATDACDQPQ